MVAARSAVPTILVLGLLLLDAVGTVSSRKVRPRSPQEDVDSAGPTTVVDKLVADINAGNVPVRQCDPADPDGSGCDAEEKGMIERVSSLPCLSHALPCAKKQIVHWLSCRGALIGLDVVAHADRELAGQRSCCRQQSNRPVSSCDGRSAS